MRILVLLLCLTFAPVCSGVAMANEWRNMNTFVEHSGFDDIIHAGVGAAAAYLIKEHSGLTGWKLRAAMIAVPLALGLIKETTDKNFDSGDILGYGVGATGVVLFTF
jgi:hypothetical protein